MASPIASPRAFNALSGSEIKNAIIADITRQLENDYHFKSHLSYPMVQWKFSLHVDAYPPEVGSFDVKSTNRVTSSDPRPIDDEEEQPQTLDFSGGREVAAPQSGQTADSVRRETGQQVPAPKRAAGPEGSRVTVETIPQSKEEIDAGVREAANRTPQVDERETRGGRTGRSVTLRTRANPKGAIAKEPQGTAPGEAEMEQIAEDIAARAAKESGTE